MQEIRPEDLAEIAPYGDAQIAGAMERVLSHPVSALIAQDYFPEVPPEALRAKAKAIQSIYDF